MAEYFMGEIRMVAFNFAPKGWALCNGQILPIAQNQALFSLLGTTYGGNGQTTFALPNLRGRGPMHFGTGPGLSSRFLGEVGGQESHTLSVSELPQHTHPVLVSNAPGTAANPSGNVLAAHRGGYAESPNVALGSGALANTGGSQPHNNMPPFMVISFCIALTGVFPPRT